MISSTGQALITNRAPSEALQFTPVSNQCCIRGLFRVIILTIVALLFLSLVECLSEAGLYLIVCVADRFACVGAALKFVAQYCTKTI